jgi:hypothetical protein
MVAKLTAILNKWLIKRPALLPAHRKRPKRKVAKMEGLVFVQCSRAFSRTENGSENQNGLESWWLLKNLNNESD